jgi:hypothetical protein
MKTRCCRSAPRCANCPVRASAAARRQAAGDEHEVLVSQILAAPRARALPPSVASALAQLELARTR